MERPIATAFARCRREGRTALLPYLMAGFPARDATPDLAAALARGGADLMELGIPFSDPTADGTAIQRAGQRALANGITVADCLRLAGRCRKQSGLPVILMGYYNPFLQYGLERFCDEAAAAGVAGLIIPDLPPEEADELQPALQRCGLDLVLLAAPTSSEQRLELVGQQSAGFVYCVTVRGVTGARSALPPDLPEYLQRMRRHTTLPIAAGFGISTAAHVREVGRYADGAVVASALVDHLEQAPPDQWEAVAEVFVRSLAAGVVKAAVA